MSINQQIRSRSYSVVKRLSTSLDFPDKDKKILSNALHFNIYQEPINSFINVNYYCRHLSHTKNKIALSLANIILTFFKTREVELSKLKLVFLQSSNLEKVINFYFKKLFEPV